MEPNFWHERWQQNQLGFHESEANSLLVAHFDALSLAPNSRVFVPLCGKTRDIAWLLSKGHRVVGIELSQLAIEQLFTDLGVKPTIETRGSLIHFGAENLDIFVGDIFDLSSNGIGPVDAIYDRAALVALPTDLRDRYAAHVRDITNGAPQLLVCFDYDQTELQPPPFSIPALEVERIHGAHYGINLLASIVVEGGLKGTCPAQESCYLLRRK